jgi:hypothetical protein
VYAASALLASLVTSVAPASSQDAGAPFGFAMTAPEGWHRITSQGLADNLRTLKISPAELQALLANHGGSVVVVAYMKYQPTAHPGLIPKIQVSLRRNPTKTFNDFFRMIARATEEPKALLPDFTVVDAPRIVQIGGRRGVVFSATLSVETKAAGKLRARTRTYAVPNGDTLFQISFTDGSDDDCRDLFDQLVGTVGFD